MDPTTQSAAAPTVTFREQSQEPAIKGLEFSHLSIEVGHFYMEDLTNGADRIKRQFERAAPWVRLAQESADTGRNTPRVSTCLLIDDYFNREPAPAEILDRLLPAAADAGMSIDYLAREAACAVSSTGIEPARLVAARLLPEPSPGSTGSRPPVQESGWLANGSGASDRMNTEAMQPRAWVPAQEFSRRNHTIFLDVELWKDVDETVGGRRFVQRVWSCPFLASVWQLMRLGLLRHAGGEPVVPVAKWDPDLRWPEKWTEMPSVIQLNPDAKPFAAYRAVSVMPQTYLPIEHCVRQILDHVIVDEPVLDAVGARARGEGVELPAAVADRVTHIFIESRRDGSG